MTSEVCIALGNLRVLSRSIPLPSAGEVDGGAEWYDQTSTTSKLLKQLHSSLTEAMEDDVEEYRPVSRYRSPDDWWQVSSPEPRIWTANWTKLLQHSETCWHCLPDVETHRHVWVEMNSYVSDCSWRRHEVSTAFSSSRFERIHSATWSMHVEMRDCSSGYSDGR